VAVTLDLADAVAEGSRTAVGARTTGVRVDVLARDSLDGVRLTSAGARSRLAAACRPAVPAGVT
jgi:hypothetical protein